MTHTPVNLVLLQRRVCRDEIQMMSRNAEGKGQTFTMVMDTTIKCEAHRNPTADAVLHRRCTLSY